ncbi:MAG: family 78 glycoside hydrolase catalytic domain [Bacteroidales bacterium]|nr:family 78 glycoside hydrolase catalytic domain [Bacteroidales bacterium]
MNCLFFQLVLAILPALAGAPAVSELKTEHLVNPLGIDNPVPRFSWHLDDDREGARQTAYRITVASDSLQFESNLLWDSGIIQSDAVLATYEGRELQPFTRYWWRVTCEDKDGAAIQSGTAFFETGFMSQNNWRGSWISDNHDKDFKPAPRFRKEFKTHGGIVQARAYIAAAGLYTMYINGAKVGDRVLEPAFTRYDRRILYTTYDITEMLRDGTNAVGVELGNGWYNHQPVTTWHFDNAPWRARPAFCMDIRIRYADGTEEVVPSGIGWHTSSEGPLVYNNIYTGEHYDARREQKGWAEPGFNEADWDGVKLRSCPAATVSSQQMVPIRESDEIEAVNIIKLNNNRYIYDFGANMAGNVHLRIKGRRGTEIELTYAERLNSAGRADQDNINYYYFGDRNAEPLQTDIVTLSGGDDYYAPQYSYKGFRYVEVNASSSLNWGKEQLKAVRVHSDVPEAGSLSSAAPVVNDLWQATRRTYLSNLPGYPTDCPQREKNGWTADAHIAVESGLYNYDAFTVYEKWLTDHRDEQQPNGVLPDIIPTCGWGYWNPAANGNGLDWTSTIALIPWALYLFYGDSKPLHDCYDGIRRYIDYALTLTKDGLTTWGRGDWVPVTTRSNKQLICSCFLYKDLDILCRAARMFGYDEDAKKYGAIAETVRNAVNAKFLNTTTGVYADGMQTDQSLPLSFGLVPYEHKDAVLKALVKRVEEDGCHVNAGVHGAKAALNVLAANGYGELAYRMATAQDFPSWGWWLANGRTTLVENWRLYVTRDNSDNHIMFGDIAAWFHRALGGINPDPEQPGFRHIILRPCFPAGQDSFACSYDSPYGKIEVSWIKKNRNLNFRTVIPCGASATLFYPDGRSEELPSGTHDRAIKLPRTQ